MDQNDWRLTNQLTYMKGVTLQKKTFVRTPRNDHEHCEFCWEKFGEEPDWLHEGYCTADAKHWVCPTCFEDFRELFAWKLMPDPEPQG